MCLESFSLHTHHILSYSIVDRGCNYNEKFDEFSAIVICVSRRGSVNFQCVRSLQPAPKARVAIAHFEILYFRRTFACQLHFIRATTLKFTIQILDNYFMT